MLPLFSLVVPVYKVEKELPRCVESLLNQTYKNIEIILVNDGSPDGCPALCDDYARLNQNVRVIHKRNGGLSDARNAGVEIATGEYVMFVDSDDYIETWSCERIQPFTLSYPDIIVVQGCCEGGSTDLSNSGLETGKHYSPTEFFTHAGKLPMAAWLYIYRTQYLREKGLLFKKGILHEDEQFTPRALLESNSIVFSGLMTYHYLIRGDSITTSSDKSKNLDDYRATCHELEEVYSDITDRTTRNRLKNKLVNGYLSLLRSAGIEQYYSKIDRGILFRNAKDLRTLAKVSILLCSPRLYKIANDIWHNI